jgi:hypothetical protein
MAHGLVLKTVTVWPAATKRPLPLGLDLLEDSDQGYGLVVMMVVPGADDIMLYEPKHPPAYIL